jgi:hypothetical protein
MPKQNPKASPLGHLHSDSVKRNAYDKGPAPAKGFPASMGSTGPIMIIHPHKEPEGKK